MIRVPYLFVLLSGLLCLSLASAAETPADGEDRKKWSNLVEQTPKQKQLIVSVDDFQKHCPQQNLKNSASYMRDAWVVTIRLRRVANRLEKMSPERARRAWEHEFSEIEWDLRNGEIASSLRDPWLRILGDWKKTIANQDPQLLPAALRQMGLIVTGLLLEIDASVIKAELTGEKQADLPSEQEYQTVAFYPPSPFPQFLPIDHSQFLRDRARYERELARLQRQHARPSHEWLEWEIEFAREECERRLTQLEQQRDYYEQQGNWYDRVYAPYFDAPEYYGDWPCNRNYVVQQSVPYYQPCYQTCRPCFRPLRWLFCR